MGCSTSWRRRLVAKTFSHFGQIAFACCRKHPHDSWMARLLPASDLEEVKRLIERVDEAVSKPRREPPHRIERRND
jgi:hypothetical protein